MLNRAAWIACWGAFGLVWLRALVPGVILPSHDWPEALFLVTSVASSLSNACRQRPSQSVVLAAAVIMGGAILTGLLFSWPKSPLTAMEFAPALGPRVGGSLPWSIPLFWLVTILNARGVARLLLRGRKSRENVGYETLGVGIGLALALLWSAWGMATGARESIRPVPNISMVLVFGALGVTTGLLLAVTAVLLLNKKPGPEPAEWQSLGTWWLMNLLLGTWAVRDRLWIAALICLAQIVVPGYLAWRGRQLGG